MHVNVGNFLWNEYRSKLFRILHFTELESDSEVEFFSIKDRNKFFKLFVFFKKNTIFKALLKH